MGHRCFLLAHLPLEQEGREEGELVLRTWLCFPLTPSLVPSSRGREHSYKESMMAVIHGF